MNAIRLNLYKALLSIVLGAITDYTSSLWRLRFWEE